MHDEAFIPTDVPVDGELCTDYGRAYGEHNTPPPPTS